MTQRLIETWMPIAALGEESVRERRSMTALPPTYYLHVWWARRPLVASRAALLASLLPADADQKKFMHMLGIHGDPVKTKQRIDLAKKTGEDLGLNPYGYERAFKYAPSPEDVQWAKSEFEKVGVANPKSLDPTAGGGSIPFESVRLGLETLGNDLNPVAVLIEKATLDWPSRFGAKLLSEFRGVADRFMKAAEPRFQGIFPPEPVDAQVLGYLWARTVICPHCDGLIPLSPNWKLAPDGTGVRLHPQTTGARRCNFEIVSSAKQQSEGTVSGGDATCPFGDCKRVVDSDFIKAEAQVGRMGEQLFCVVFKQRFVKPGKVGKTGKVGKPREAWERGYRAPRVEDDVAALIEARLAEKLSEWEALDIVPSESVPNVINDDRPIQYGMPLWRDLFSRRQLLGHGTAVEVFRELLEADRSAGLLTDERGAAFGYLALSLDKMLNYNSRMSVWMPTREVIANTFNRHDFAFCWSHAEMAPAIVGLGYDWAVEQTAKCIRELVELVQGAPVAPVTSEHPQQALAGFAVQETSVAYGARTATPTITLTCGSGDDLSHLPATSVDVVVMDPPYYDNVMYAELSDFFYVWLKRTAGYVFPELFRQTLTDKEREAVANPARFKAEGDAKLRAGRDYQNKMASIFAEMRRVLKPDGVMTLMFTHKATGAWDALTTGLMQAGFTITASWPINTEAEGSLHIKDKSAANSTIFLVCRPRVVNPDAETHYWEEVEPKVAAAVRESITRFQQGGIKGVDLYLSCFGPALQEFSAHWPLQRGTPRPEETARRRKKQTELFAETYDPYAVTPEDALNAARSEVKRWRLEDLTRRSMREDMDGLTAFFVLAWDAFESAVFPYDEALRLARVCGVDLDREVVGRLAEKKTSDLVLWDSATRAAKGAMGSPDGSGALIHVLHNAAHLARSRTLDTAREFITAVGLTDDAGFHAALNALLEVLPVGQGFSKLGELPDTARGAGADFDALEGLRRLAFTQQVQEPRSLTEQMKLLEVA